MKKFLLPLLLLLLILPFFSSVEISFKENFSQGETIIAKISGTFLSELTSSNVVFYKDNHTIPLVYKLTKLNEEYYLFASLSDKLPGNYSFVLKNIVYNKGSTTSREEIVKPFIVTQEKALFSINPGFIVTKEDFYLEIKNLAENTTEIKIKSPVKKSGEREILIDSSGELFNEKSFSLISGKNQKINFKLGGGNTSLQYLEISSGNLTYQVPIYVLASEQNITIQSLAEFSLEPSQAIYEFPSNSSIKKIFYLYNFGNTNLENISISVSDSLSHFVNLSNTSIKKLDSNSSIPLELTFYSSSPTQIDGQVIVETKGKISYSTISINFSSNTSQVKSVEKSSNSCEALKGTICLENQKCDIEPRVSSTGLCCMGVCQTTQSSGLNKKVIAISLILIVVVIGLWFYFKKFKNIKNSPNLLSK